MAGLDELRITFFQECEDLLEQLGEGLRSLRGANGLPDIETLHSVFRAVHSIKGGAGAFGLTELVEFAHIFETVLDHLRSGRLTLSESLLALLLRAGDFLNDLVACARDGLPSDGDRRRALMSDLDEVARTVSHGAEKEAETIDFVPVAIEVPAIAVGTPSVDIEVEAGREPSRVHTFEIEFTPLGAMYGTGNDPVPIVRSLRRLGSLTVEADLSRVRPLATFEPSEPQASWRIRIETEARREEIEAVFEFVADLARIAIRTTADAAGETDARVAPAAPTPDPSTADDGPSRIAAIGSPTATGTLDSGGRSGGGSSLAATPVAGGSGAATIGAGSPGAASPATIRVNLDRVDRLINLVGELVIMEARLSQVISKAGLAADSDVASGLEGIKQLASEVQESVMAIRAQPLKPVFQRMHRIVREAAEATGKIVTLDTVGETTEVDKTVIERLVDPLTHMIRNAVDHGIEPPDVRLAAGKPREGKITLSSAHRSFRVVIEVADDFFGIYRAKVRAAAERKGLVQPGTAMSPNEIDNLLFLPGFSSKEEVSALSGRGVGLDVVRREIQALGGRVAIDSVPGRGTTFIITLPLTLAVLQGMLVSIGGETMVLPLSAVVETLHATNATLYTVGRHARLVANRGELLPIIDLAEVFDLSGEPCVGGRGVLIVVECDGGRRAALKVDHIEDQRQVVIKSIEENYGNVFGISAATILGNGRIALSIDPDEIISSTTAGMRYPALAEAV